jgi:hypothetical protein
MPWSETCAMDERMRFVVAASEDEAVKAKCRGRRSPQSISISDAAYRHPFRAMSTAVRASSAPAAKPPFACNGKLLLLEAAILGRYPGRYSFHCECLKRLWSKLCSRSTVPYIPIEEKKNGGATNVGE